MDTNTSTTQADSLTKRYTVEYKPRGGTGWIVEKSFDLPGEASEYIRTNAITPNAIRLVDNGFGPRPEKVILEDWTAV